jgi:hypothetical protein
MRIPILISFGMTPVKPGFGAPFSGFANERKLTNDEWLRTVRSIVVAEYEAM